MGVKWQRWEEAELGSSRAGLWLALVLLVMVLGIGLVVLAVDDLGDGTVQRVETGP